MPTSPCFLIRDVAANSGFAEIRDRAKDVRLNVKKTGENGVNFFDVTLENLTGKDRALTLSYVLPLPKGELVWHVDARNSVTLTEKSRQRMTVANVRVGTGSYSRYPFIAVGAAGKGIALGADPTAPAFSRMVCHPAMHLLHFSTDLALPPEVPKAHFKFCSFQFNHADAFRGALEKYYTIFPENSVVRLKKQGVWMAFAPISKVQGWEDFGFLFKEGDSEPAWDDAHHILTFKYTEPCTWWMSMAKKNYTYDDCVKRVNELVSKGDPNAIAWKNSAFQDENGRFPGELLDTPWCKGIVWSMNSAPYLDVMGTETNWKLGEIWQPISDSQLMYKRSLCGAKPFCFLMNTDFTKFTYACSKKFMMRSLAYGMFPGYFSANASTGHYFTQPALYDRDRPLFKKYIPLCKRVAEAGWRPVNRLLSSSNENVITEQFGSDKGNSYTTVFNLSDKPHTVTLEWKTRAPQEKELVYGEKLQWNGKKCTLTIPAETVKVLAF